jgi:hypothetical protein
MNELDREAIGGNQPPEMVATAAEVTQDLGHWLSENPVIEAEEQAREAKLFLDRGRNCIADIETERSGLVKPLNDRVTQINSRYRGPKELLQKVVDELRNRLDRYIRAEEERRIARAEQARLDAERAGVAARDAERIEQDALGNAATGVLDIDVSRLVSDANQAFEGYKKAERQAALAEKETHVKIGGGFRRALGLRDREVLTVPDPFKAIDHLWPNADIEAAIVKAARAYKKKHGKYPEGIWVIRKRGI